jgi:hypothetical protein
VRMYKYINSWHKLHTHRHTHVLCLCLSSVCICVWSTEGGGFPLSRCVCVYSWMGEAGDREGGRRVWVYPGTPGIIQLLVTRRN